MAAEPVNPDRRKRGYRRLAEFMAWDPALAIFPRFRAANNLNLLLLQAEISELEDDINLRSEIEDSLDDAKKSCDFAALRDDRENDTRWKKCLELRAKLAEYNQALVYQIVLNDQLNPTELDFSHLQNWLEYPHGGNNELRGPGSLNWMPEPFGKPSSDHVALAAKLSRKNTLSLQLANLLFPLIKKLPPSWTKYRSFMPDGPGIDSPGDFATYASNSVRQSFADRVASFAACLIILVPVITLHFLPSATERLVVIVIFTLVFTGLMALVTEAKRPEIFMATAAFVAVQVVYVGSVVGRGVS